MHVPVVVSVAKEKITLTVVSQREPWAAKLRRWGCTGSQKAVLFSTTVCSPRPLNSLSFLSVSPSSWEVPGDSKAHWLIRSQVKHCPAACYKAKVNDDVHKHTHSYSKPLSMIFFFFVIEYADTHTGTHMSAHLLSQSDSCSCSLLTTGISLCCIWYNDIIPSICWVVRHYARRLSYEIGVPLWYYFRIWNGCGVGL